MAQPALSLRARALRSLARRAYAIYVIHPPVVVGVALAWRDVAAPALLKFAVTGTLACAMMMRIASRLMMPCPEPIGDPSGITAGTLYIKLPASTTPQQITLP